MYWWHIVNSGESSLIQKCFKAQQNYPVKKDWIFEIENDKKEFSFKITDIRLKNHIKE